VICSRNEKNVKEAEASLRAKGISVYGKSPLTNIANCILLFQYHRVLFEYTGLACHVGTSEARTKLVTATVAKFGRIDILGRVSLTSRKLSYHWFDLS
jgi:hypothetical protein